MVVWIAVITAVYERNGYAFELEPDAAAVTVTLPMLVDVPCQLVFVTIDEATQEQVLIPVEYAVDNGNMVFTVNQLGLFLLIAEQQAQLRPLRLNIAGAFLYQSHDHQFVTLLGYSLSTTQRSIRKRLMHLHIHAIPVP